MGEQDFRVQKGIVVADGDVTVPADHVVYAGTFDTNVDAAGVTLTGTTLAADGTDNHIDINLTPKGTGEVNITKVDIDAGAIDGVTIGTNSAVTDLRVDLMKLDGSTFSTVSGNTNLNIAPHGSGGTTFGGTAREAESLLQINGNPKGGGTNGSTLMYTEARLHSDISNDDIAGSWNAYYGMSNALVLDNAENNAGSGQSVVFTEGRSGTSGSGSSFSIGRQLGGHNTASNAKFQIGYKNASYEEVGYANDAGNDHHPYNPALPGYALLEIDVSGNVQLSKGRGSASEGKLIFSGEASDGTDHTISLKAPHNTMTADQNYTLPVAPAGSNGYVLSSTTAGVMSWVAQSGGVGNSLSSSDNKIVRMDGTDDVQGSTASIDDSGNMTVLGTITGTTITSSLGIASTKDTDGEFIALTLTNQSDAADTSGIVSQLFNLEDTGGTTVDAGKIAVKKEQSFTGTASTQDSEMGFWTSLNGTLTEQMTIASDGDITTTSDLTLGGDLTVGDDIILNSDDAVISPVLNNGSNVAGHTLYIKGGQGTGSGASGDIIFHTKTANGSGATGLHTMGAAMTLSGGDVTIHGDLTVSGDTITANVGTLDVEDKNITLNKGAGDTSSTADGAGITIQDAVSASTDATLLWTAATDRFGFSHGLDVTGTLTADTSLTLDSTTITTAEIGVLDSVTAGTVTASKALVVDSNRDLATIGNLTSDGAIRGATLSVDAVAIIDTATQATNQSWNNSETKTLYTYVANTYRSVKIVGEISNGTDVDIFEALVTWKGTGSTPSASSDVHVTTYAYIASSGTPLGTLTAVKDTNNIDINFTVGGSGAGNYRWTITATQLVNNYAN